MDVVAASHHEIVVILDVVISFSREGISLLQLDVCRLQDGLLGHVVDETSVSRDPRLLRNPAKEHQLVLSEGNTAHHGALPGDLILSQVFNRVHFQDRALEVSHWVRLDVREDLLLLFIGDLLEAEVEKLIHLLSTVELVADEGGRTRIQHRLHHQFKVVPLIHHRVDLFEGVTAHLLR